MLWFVAMRYREVKGHWPFLKAKKSPEAPSVEQDPTPKTEVSEKMTPVKDA